MPIILTPVLIAKAAGRLCEGLISLLESQPSIQILGVIHHEKAFYEELERINEPFILIMDIDLFGEKIFEVCQKIKGEKPYSGCILLVNTIDEKEKSQTAGANEALIKGYSMDELLDAIQRVRFIKFLAYGPKEEARPIISQQRVNS